MANPTLTPFPTPPLPEQDEVTFNRNAANSLLAQANFVTEGNIVITWMGQQIDAAAASKKAAADSAAAAAQSANDAATTGAAQVKLATDQAVASKGSADAAAGSLASVKVVAQAVDAAAGLPPAGPVGSVLRVKNAQGEKEFAVLILSQVGDTLVSSQAPDSSWVPTGRIYNQSTYPTLYSKLGAIADWLPSQQLQGALSGNYTYNDMAYGSGIFAAPDGGGNGIVMTSPDGVTWTQRNMPNSVNWSAIEYGNNFVAVATGTTFAAATSPDGITWTARSMPAQANWSNVKFISGTYLAVVGSSTIAATSVDGGASWTPRTMPNNSNSGLYGLAAGSGLFVSLLGNSTTYYTSPNGVNWTARTLPIIPNGIIFANAMFFAWNNGGGGAYSTDGVNWQTISIPTTGNNFVINGGGGLFIMKIAGMATYYTATAAEVGKWTSRTAPWIDNTTSKSVYANRSFVSLDTNGNNTRRSRRPWSYDPAVQFYTTDPVVQSQGLGQYIKAA